MKILDKFFTDRETKDVSIAILVEPTDLEGVELDKVSHKNKSEKGFEIWASALAVAEYKLGKRRLQFLTRVVDNVTKGYFNLVRTADAVMSEALKDKDLAKYAKFGNVIAMKSESAFLADIKSQKE